MEHRIIKLNYRNFFRQVMSLLAPTYELRWNSPKFISGISFGRLALRLKSKQFDRFLVKLLILFAGLFRTILQLVWHDKA